MKTLLVHLNDQRRADALLAPVVALAGRHGSHLVGLHVYGGLPPLAAGGVPYGADVIEAVLESEQREAAAIEKIFRAATAGGTFVAEWSSEKSPHPDLAAFVMQRARACDLVVASQSDATWDMAPALDFPERLALECGRPVLIVPASGRFETVARNIVVAWNGSRESSRAAFDALPLMRDADSVVVLTVADARQGARRAAGDAHELAAALARHGIKVAVSEETRDHQSTGAALLDGAAAAGGDLLVMGGYGHSRFRELIFGGATRHVLHNMTFPVLLSH